MQPKKLYEFGPYRLNPAARVLFRDGEVVPLTPKCLDILAVLLESGRELVTKDELMQAVWPDTVVEEGNLTQNVSILRKVLGAPPGGGSYIETFPKRGYRFSFQAQIVDDGAANAMPPQPAPRPPVSRKRVGAVVAILAAVGIVAAATFIFQSTARTSKPIHSLAVLPFENLTGDASQEYLVDGFTEAVIGNLARIRTLRVISRTSAMRYKDTSKSLPMIAGELGVEGVVEGAVSRSGDRIQVRVQMIRAATDEHMLSEHFESELRDLPTLQESVALEIAEAVRTTALPDERARLQHLRGANPEAFENYLRGRYHWNQRTPESLKTAARYFQASLAADPVYAPAYVGLADTYNQMGTVLVSEKSPLEARKLAAAAARKALEIDPELAEAYAALAYTDLYNWNWDRAQRGFLRAIELKPGYAPAHLWYAQWLTTQKRFEEALQQVNLASDLDPLSPIIQTQVGWILYFMKRYEEAAVRYEKVLESNPEYVWAHWQLAGAKMSLGRFDEALAPAAAAVAYSHRTPSTVGTLATVYVKLGNRGKALELLRELEAMSRTRYVSPWTLAYVHLALGNRDELWKALDRAFEERVNGLAYIAVIQEWEPVLGTPRGQELLRRIGLAP